MHILDWSIRVLNKRGKVFAIKRSSFLWPGPTFLMNLAPVFPPTAHLFWMISGRGVKKNFFQTKNYTTAIPPRNFSKRESPTAPHTPFSLRLSNIFNFVQKRKKRSYGKHFDVGALPHERRQKRLPHTTTSPFFSWWAFISFFFFNINKNEWSKSTD
jgi:hypothetical protein